MNNFKIAVLAIIWNNILSRFNSSSKAFQAMDANLQIIIDLLGSLDDYLESFRGRFEEMEWVAAKLSETTIAEFSICRTRRRNTRYDDNPNPNSENQEAVSAKQKFICETFYVIIDQLRVALK